jgi:dGTPase
VIERLTIPSDHVATALDERFVKEPPPSVRSEAQRDRDRILYSSAFLRLGQVTQVATPETGFIFHSRLTHSIKVAQVARGLAQRLKWLAGKGELDPGATRLVECLDEDAAEAAALAHDLGHPPFGHLAENVLQTQAKHATFEGNAQSFRIVTRLALRAANAGEGQAPVGLNLTRRTLNGILKYPWLREEEPEDHHRKWGAYPDGDKKAFEWTRRNSAEGERSLEACLMDWADDVTYAVHDMDDFFRARLIPLERLATPHSLELERFKQHLSERTEDLAGRAGENAERYPEAAQRFFAEGAVSTIDLPFSGRTDERVTLRQLGSHLIGLYISALQLRDAEDGESVELVIDDDIVDQVKVLKQLTWFYVINRPSLAVIQRGQAQVIETLFTMYRTAVAADEPHLLPPLFAERVDEVRGDVGKERVVIDLIAGMTESSAAEIYRQRTGVTPGSVLAQVAGPA